MINQAYTFSLSMDPEFSLDTKQKITIEVKTLRKTVKSLKKLLMKRKITVNSVLVLNVKTVSMRTKQKKV